MLKRSSKSQVGFTLVELMVGLTIGLIVIGVVGSVFLSILRSSTDTLESLKLNQEMRSVMALMVSDIRRAGYWGGAVDAAGTVGYENQFTTREGVARDIQIYDDGQCIMFSYDLDLDGDGDLFDEEGSDDAAPLMGFNIIQEADSIHSVGGIPPREDMSGGQDTSTCGDTLFESFTDERILNIMQLGFSTVGSVCFNLDQNVSWTLPPGSRIAACEATATTGASGYAPPDTGDRLVEVRNIHITMVGQHVADPEVEMALESDVLVRTNRTLIAN